MAAWFNITVLQNIAEKTQRPSRQDTITSPSLWKTVSQRPITLKGLDKSYEKLLDSILWFTKFKTGSIFGERVHTRVKQSGSFIENQQISEDMAEGITLRLWIGCFSWLPSLLVTEQAMTGLVTPQARPRACFEGTKTYGTFCIIQQMSSISFTFIHCHKHK